VHQDHKSPRKGDQYRLHRDTGEFDLGSHHTIDQALRAAEVTTGSKYLAYLRA